MFYDHGFHMGGMHTFWWVVLIVVLLLALRSLSLRGRECERQTPHEMLRHRLARGEITPEAYEQAKRCSTATPPLHDPTVTAVRSCE